MKTIRFLGPENDGDQSEIDALFRVYPYLKAICRERKISVLYLRPTTELPTHQFPSFALGFNDNGRIYGVKGGQVVREISWEEVRASRKEHGLRAPYDNSPQTALSGDEEACVLVQEHHSDDHEQHWISVEAFVCPPETSLQDFPTVKTWLAEISVRNELREAGFIR